MIDVVYLAYSNEAAGYGIEMVENFLNSYKNHPAGIQHNLVIIAKNWADESQYNQLKTLSEENNAKLIDLPDDGFDIGAYFRAAKLLQNEYVLFLGSNVELEVDNWLSLLYKAFESSNSVQLVGPMGAWAQGLSGVFPNPHIRTTSFMIKRILFLEYASTQKFPETKEDTYGLEHCSNSLSNFVFNKGYDVVVVNSDGKIFKKEDWAKSQTYFSMGESKLILKDKWVRYFETLSELEQIKTVMTEWGKNFETYPKNLVKDFSDKINVFIPYRDIIDVFSTNVFHPIFIGEINTRLETEALQDNTGINISDKDKTYGDLVAYYWVWKNYLQTTNSEYVGFCQHSHFFDFSETKANKLSFNPIFFTNFKKTIEECTDEKIFKQIQDYDVIATEKIELSTSFYEQAISTVKKEDYDLAIDVIKEIYPQYSQAVEEVMVSNSMYFFGNFIMKKELLNEFLEWLFNILFALDKKINWSEYGNYADIIQSAFSSERFLNIWLAHQAKTQNINVKSQKSAVIYYDFQAFMNATLERMQQTQNNIGN